jgi:hypothetical protein
LAEGVRYYSKIDAELGIRFYSEMERLIREVCSDPQRFRRFDPPVRRHFGNWFPYAIVYLDEPDKIVIVAVMHMRQRPGYWKDRII